ncbi:MAG: hypothetical protein NTZ17_09340 [Phycisphaerae bacterium]|nr:hypothetical protein [Phycisphaerae bacterium]
MLGYLGDGGEVKDLGIADVSISSSGWYVGGLVGENSGSVTQCYSTGAVSGNQSVYGPHGCIGGLVGFNGGSVTLCYSTGAVSGTGNYDCSVGGLVGYNYGNVTLCYSAGVVSGTGDWGSVGGLVGWNCGGCSVTQCYSTGMVSGTGNQGSVGGLVGENEGAVTQCYSTGAVSGAGQYGSVGGLVGESFRGTVGTGCFWDTQTSGQTKSAGGTGKTTTEMQDIRTYRSAGWDFWGEDADGIQEIWQMPQGGGYPVLAVFGGYAPPQLQGQGTAQDPYLIRNAVELGAMVYHSPHAHYRLAVAIDLSGIRWGTAVIPWFAGTFDGNGLTISNLKIEDGSYLGLFGRLDSGGEVKDLAVVGVRITGSGSIGGLVGQMLDGSLTRCYSTGAVKGTGWGVGGLVGENGQSCPGGYSRGGTISTCHSTCETTGGGYVGGLVGGNGGSVTQCYSTGATTGKDHVGGLVGFNVEDVTSGTKPGLVTACFWDTQASCQTK